MTAPDPEPGRAGETVHPLLSAAFGVLNSASLRWALLRTPSRFAAPTGDVDLLVHPGDAPALAGLLRPLGFVALPWRATPPEMLLTAHHRETGTWLVLDVVTELSFGPDLCYRLAAADPVLGRSRRWGALSMLAPDDGFWALLLHCLLEKDSTPERHRETLVDLAARADADGPLGTTVNSCCPAGWRSNDLVAAVRHGRWDDLDGIRLPLRAAWRRARPDDVRRAHRLRARRLLRGPLTVVQRRGVAVVILGPNGAGKSTVAGQVIAAFPAPARLTYLGLWKQTRPAGPARSMVRIAARPFMVWGRYGRSLWQRATGKLVLFDRYVYDAALPPQPPLLALKRPYLWLLAHSCPPPTATVVLDVPGEVAWRRKGENTVDELEIERRTLLRLVDRVRRGHVVDGTRPVDDVVADVTAIVWACYVTRWTSSWRSRLRTRARPRPGVR